MSHLLRLARLAIVFTAAAISHAAPTGFSDYADALAEAKSSGKDIILFEDGSNWLPDSSVIREQLNDPALRQKLGEKVIWAYHDNPEDITPPAVAPSGPKPDYSASNLPALVIIGPDGFTHAASEGVLPKTVASVAAVIPDAIARRQKRDELWKQARETSGKKSATLLAQGLETMTPAIARARKDIRGEMKKADPADESGYNFKFDFEHNGGDGFHGGIISPLIRDKKYGEVVAKTAEMLKNPVLTNNQRQIILSGRFQAYRASGDIPRALKELETIRALDPTTDMGEGARYYYSMHHDPVILKGLSWGPSDNRPVWLPMVANVTKLITTAGAYEIEFKHRDGSTSFRRVWLRVGSTELASVENKEESHKVRLTIATLPTAQGAKIELCAESHGNGWFAGKGDIIVTKVQ